MEATGFFFEVNGFGNDGNGFASLRGKDWVSILGFVILCQKRIVEQFHEIQLEVRASMHRRKVPSKTKMGEYSHYSRHHYHYLLYHWHWCWFWSSYSFFYSQGLWNCRMHYSHPSRKLGLAPPGIGRFFSLFQFLLV